MEEYEVELADMAYGGEAVGRLNGQVVFVPFGIPGERVKIRLVQVKKDYARASLEEVLRPSPDRVDPPCPYFGQCGGCQWQHLAYSRQLELKRRIVAEQLRRIGGIAEAEVLVQPTIGMVDPWEYRNHARFSVGRRYGELCFTRPHSRRLLRIDRCLIMRPTINDALARLQGRCGGVRAHQMTIRCGDGTRELLVNPLVPGVLGPDEASDKVYHEVLLGRRFEVPTPAFFQVNTRAEERGRFSLTSSGGERGTTREDHDGAQPAIDQDRYSMSEILASLVLAQVGPPELQLVLDLYCGVGTFAVLLAGRAQKVIGIEESVAAVEVARRNAVGLDNVTFLAGKVEEVLPSLDGMPDAVVLDPSRAGCHPKVLDALLLARPRRIVYVSCDPPTLARDLGRLIAGGYGILLVQPVDMFPQTYHVEAVAVLEERGFGGLAWQQP